MPTLDWKIFSPNNSAQHLSEDHDYVVMFARKKKDVEAKIASSQRRCKSALQDRRKRSPRSMDIRFIMVKEKNWDAIEALL